jgi:exodeoxyribonuclease VIII
VQPQREHFILYLLDALFLSIVVSLDQNNKERCISTKTRGEIMKTGLYENISDVEYHKGNDGHLSSSQLKYAYKNMGLFKAMTMEGMERYDSNVLKFGRAAHCFILEPEKFDSTYMVFDDSGDMRRKENKEARKEFEAKAREVKRELLNLSDYEKIAAMSMAVQNYEPARGLLSGGVAEVSGYYSLGDIDLKVRPDYINHEKRVIVDLKTSRDASLQSFTRDFKWNFHYDLSAAMYLDGVKKITGNDYEYYFVVVEKEAPYSIAVYKLSEDSRKFGESKYLEALSKIALCRDTKEYRLQNRVQEI